MRDFRIRVRGIILAIAGFIAVFLFLRVTLDTFNANDENFLVNLINVISDIFITPFKGIFVIDEGSDFQDLNADALAALVFIVIGGILISEIVTAFLYDKASTIILNVIDTFFKIVEGVIFIRLVLNLFLVSSDQNSFSKLIINLTQWTRNITNLTFLEDRIYLSTVIVLILVVIFDITSDSFIKSLIERSNKNEEKKRRVNVVQRQYPSIQPMNSHQLPSAPVQPIHQTINVNIPTGQPLQNQQVPQVHNNFVNVPIPKQIQMPQLKRLPHNNPNAAPRNGQ
ncbi:MAG: hypothetical protein Q9M91_06530 [Candidatus Dojkabacteria bacterium]|nr:hypothetical protein [Candidatus Dojkabacteria bacterium]MDQ7021452.1 hypothetical protein [Candidatus Dojkabacteria bacterium]